MTDPIDFDAKRAARRTPLAIRSISDWDGEPVPERDWLIPSVLLRRSITLFSGDGGTGKSLLSLQLQIAAALGIDWMGLPIKERLQSFALYCEDDEDEIHRRADDICRHYGVTFRDLGGLVNFVCRVGETSELIEFRGYKESAKPVRTGLLDQITDHVREYQTKLIIIDTISDAFAGNENIRPQVRAFVTMIRSLSLINNGGVMLNAHPSKSSMADGSGFSGSTAWNGSVRNRLYLTVPKKSQDEEEGPNDERVLKIMKSNYGPFGEQIKCRWERGVFVRTDVTGPGSLMDRLADHDRALKAAEYLIKNGATLGADPMTRSSFVTAIRSLPSCRDLSFSRARAVQDRLLESGQLVRVEIGPKSKRKVCVRPSYLKYPGEAKNANDSNGQNEEGQ